MSIRQATRKFSLFALLLHTSSLLSPLAKAEDIRSVWYQDVVKDHTASEVGRNWWLEDANRLSTNVPGKMEWTSACPWDERPAFAAGGNYQNSSIIQLGDRQVGPTPLKLFNIQGRGQTRDSMVFTQALQTLDEVRAFENKKIRVGFHFMGSLDRCPTWVPPTVQSKSYDIIRSTIMLATNCDAGAAPTLKNITLWKDRAFVEWSAHESMGVDLMEYIDFDSSKCTGPLFVSLTLGPQERLTFDSLEVTINTIN